MSSPVSLHTLLTISLNTALVSFLLLPFLVLISPSLLLAFVSIPTLSILFLYKTCLLPTPQNRSFKNILLAHRGGHPIPQLRDGGYLPIHPENSFEAFEYAISKNADGIEIDVWLSKDDEIVVFHDAHTMRLTKDDRKRPINSVTLDEIKKLKYKRTPKIVSSQTLVNENSTSHINGSANVNTDDGARVFESSRGIPTLKEVFELLNKNPNLKLMIEVKEQKRQTLLAQKLVELFKQYDLYDQAFVAAFNPLVLYELRKLEKRIVTAFLFTNNITDYWIETAQGMGLKVPFFIKDTSLLHAIINNLLRYGVGSILGLKFLGCGMVCVDQHILSSELLKYYENHDIVVASWTVNTREQKEYFYQCGITVISDFHFGK